MQKRIAFVIGMIFTLTFFFACQKRPRPSPGASATCDLGGGKTITTNYSSPHMKGRNIYGDLDRSAKSVAPVRTKRPPSLPAAI